MPDPYKIAIVLKRFRKWWLINRNEINDPRGYGVSGNYYFCMPVGEQWAFVYRDGRCHPYLASPPETPLTAEQKLEIKEMVRQRKPAYDGIPPFPAGDERNVDFEAKWYPVYTDDHGRFLQMAD